MGEIEANGGRIEKADYVNIGYLPQDGIQLQARPYSKKQKRPLVIFLNYRIK